MPALARLLNVTHAAARPVVTYPRTATARIEHAPEPAKNRVTEQLDRLLSADHVGVLFSGGSSRAAFQIGVIETLLELGVRPAACLGVSAGAWNAAALAAGTQSRLRAYWRCFVRMPYFDLSNLFREHSPFIYTHLHERAFERYVGGDRLRSPEALPLFIAATRLRDRASVVFDAREFADPLKLLLATNYLPPFYTHPVEIDGIAYGDGGFSDNAPYEALLEHDCDMVIVIASKGESEGGLYRSLRAPDHEIPADLRERVVVIRPRHRMPVSFTERRWSVLEGVIRLGALRTREVLLGERHAETDVRREGASFSSRVLRVLR